METDDYWEIIPSSEYANTFLSVWVLKKVLGRPSCFLWPDGRSSCPTLSLCLSFLIPGDNKIRLPDGRERLTGTSIWVQNNGNVSFSVCHDEGHVIFKELSPGGVLHIYLMPSNEWKVNEMIACGKNGVSNMHVSGGSVA